MQNDGGGKLCLFLTFATIVYGSAYAFFSLEA